MLTFVRHKNLPREVSLTPEEFHRKPHKETGSKASREAGVWGCCLRPNLVGSWKRADTTTCHPRPQLCRRVPWWVTALVMAQGNDVGSTLSTSHPQLKQRRAPGLQSQSPWAGPSPPRTSCVRTWPGSHISWCLPVLTPWGASRSQSCPEKPTQVRHRPVPVRAGAARGRSCHHHLQVRERRIWHPERKSRRQTDVKSHFLTWEAVGK